jgi:hypothetical protein
LEFRSHDRSVDLMINIIGQIRPHEKIQFRSPEKVEFRSHEIRPPDPESDMCIPKIAI